MEAVRDIERGRIGFGKYKGAQVSNIPTQYLKQCVDPYNRLGLWLVANERPEYSMIADELAKRG